MGWKQERSEKYQSKLKDPRWQRKRLEILQRDDFTCQHCYSSTKTLHVHHRLYLKNKDPWESPAYNLVTLCEDCHNIETDTYASEEQILLSALKECGFCASDLNNLYSSLIGSPFGFKPYTNEVDLGHICWLIRHFNVVRDDVEHLIRQHMRRGTAEEDMVGDADVSRRE